MFSCSGFVVNLFLCVMYCVLVIIFRCFFVGVALSVCINTSVFVCILDLFLYLYLCLCCYICMPMCVCIFLYMYRSLLLYLCLSSIFFNLCTCSCKWLWSPSFVPKLCAWVYVYVSMFYLCIVASLPAFFWIWMWKLILKLF